MQTLNLNGADGSAIVARLYRPEGPARAAVLIGGAMGVRQSFYEPFARWLASQGYLTLSFDYRGAGDSLPRGRSLRGFDADLFDWARDTDTAIEALAAEAGGAPLYIVGHSLGAQLPGLLQQRDRVAGLLSVAAGSGYWRDNAPQLKRMVLYFWHVLVPVATAVCGYFPGKRIGKEWRLSRTALIQWLSEPGERKNYPKRRPVGI